MKYRNVWGSIVCAAATLLAAPEVYACTCGGTEGIAFSADGRVPANVEGIVLWRGKSGFEGPDWSFTLERRTDGAWVEEAAEATAIVDPGGFSRTETAFVIRPSPFAEGDEFRVHSGFGKENVVTEVEVVAPLDVAEDAPTLTVGAAESTDFDISASSSCRSNVWGVAKTLRMELPTELEPYRELLMYETTVDGEPLRRSSDLCDPVPVGRTWYGGAGEDRLAMQCATDGSDGTSTEFVNVQMHAYVAGSTMPVWSTSPRTISLTCDQTCAEVDPATERYKSCEQPVGCSTTGGTNPLAPLALVGLLLATPRRRRGGVVDS